MKILILRQSLTVPKREFLIQLLISTQRNMLMLAAGRVSRPKQLVTDIRLRP